MIKRFDLHRRRLAADPPAADPGLTEELAPHKTPGPTTTTPAKPTEPSKKVKLDPALLPKNSQQVVGLCQQELKRHSVTALVAKEPTLEGTSAEVLFSLTGPTKGQLFFTVSTTTFSKGLVDLLFSFCGFNYVGVGKEQIASLLDAIGQVQNAKVSPTVRLPKPSDPTNQADSLEWAKLVVMELLARNAKLPIQNTQAVLKEAEDAVKAGNLKEETFTSLKTIVDHTDPEVWATTMKQSETLLKNQKYRKVVSKDALKPLLDKLTGGRYTGRVVPKYAKDGSLVVAITAPFPLFYVFTKKLGEVSFKQMLVAICKYTYAATTVETAIKLLGAVLTLGLAHGRAVKNLDKAKPRKLRAPGPSPEKEPPRSSVFLYKVYDILQKHFPDVKVKGQTSRIVGDLIEAKKATPQELTTALALLFKELAKTKLTTKTVKTILDLEAGSPSPQIFSNKFVELLRTWKL